MDGAGEQRWLDVLGSVQTLAVLIQTFQDAFGEDEAAPKVSATTKKRLTVRAMQGLQGGSELVQALAANMRELQQAVQQQQEAAAQTLDSNASLQQQLRSCNEECHSSKRALLQTESQKLAMQQQVEQLQQQLRAASAEEGELQGTICELQTELQTAVQQAADAHGHLGQLQEQMEQLAAAAKQAEAGADAAAGGSQALQAAREDAGKERAGRVRHEDAVARLTADNLVFMARLRAAEAGAAAAAAERDELRLALEQHKGPWMDEVHQGVELRVKAAMARAEQLQAQQELAAAQHAQHTQQLQQQQADLEAALGAGQRQAAELRQQLLAAQAAASEARAAAEEAAVLAASAQAAADERAAELRVAQDSLRSMREECNECWMSERDARTQLVGLQERLDAQEASLAKLKRQLQARSDDLATQRAVNQQLMLKKEEVEWQLLAAIAQLHNHPAPPLAAAASGSPESLSTQDSADAHQQQQQQQAAAATDSRPASTAPAAEEALLSDQLSSPFGPPAQLPLSPVQASPRGQQLHPCMQPHAAPRAGIKLTPPAAAEVPGPAAIAAGGGLWQLPNGSSGALFGYGSRVSSSTTVHPLAALSNPMPAATAAAVEALLGSHEQSLHHAFSCPEGDLYSLPRLGFGLATLPTPEQLLAAAEAAANGSGSLLQKTVTIGRAGSLTVPVSMPPPAPAAAVTAGGACGSAGAAAAARRAGGGGSAAAAGAGGLDDSMLPPDDSDPAALREAIRSSDGGGPIGSLTFPHPPPLQPLLLGATGGLMAPFTPLSPGAKGPSSSVGRGAVFPECITASAVTDAEQGELGCFSFAAGGLTDALQQQQALGPGFWYLQQQQQQRPHQQRHRHHHHHHHGSSGSLSDGAQHAHHSSSPCASSGSLHEQQQQRGRERSKDGSPPTRFAAADAAAAGAAAAAADEGGSKQRISNDSTTSKDDDGSSSNSSNAGSNAHLHGILLNGPNSRSRSPARGISPSGSMKSVRFSFEGLDSHGVPTAPDAAGDQEQQGDQKGGRRSAGGSSSGARRSRSPQSNGRGMHGHGGGSEWLRHTLYEQLASHTHPSRGVVGSVPGAAGGGGSHSADHPPRHTASHHTTEHDPAVAAARGGRFHSSGGGSSSSSSRQPRGWAGGASHPPAHAARGVLYMGQFAQGRQCSREDFLRQQQRQVRQQQAEREVAAMAAAVKDRVQPKAPVHPIFGVMHSSSAGAVTGPTNAAV